ncbi:phage tail component protein [Enterococcus faecalis 06-MB-DW-09]|nr:phage tail component protein [Enterococcus faecalis 06-MB-DW-09]
MENQLTSLLKKKYGTTTSSPVVFTDKDTLYTAFRKLADNIYKNGSWTQEDELRAVDTFIRNRYGYPVGTEEALVLNGNGQPWSAEVKVSPVEEVESIFLRSKAEGKSVYSATAIRKEINGSEERVKTVNVVLDPKNKNGTKHGEFYYFTPSSSKDPEYYALGNMNRAIGYDKLQRDILKEFDESDQEWKFARRDLERLLEQLSIASYTGKKNAHLFQKNSYGELTDAFLDTLPRDEGEKYLDNPSQMKKLLDSNEVQGEERQWLEEQLAANWGDLSDAPENPVKVNLEKSPYLLKEGYRTTYLYPKTIQNARKQNQVIDFVEGYIQNTYDIFLQQEYEKDIDKQTRASAWQTKKNINKDTRKIMESTTLNKYFQFVEIDNDVDLALFSQFEEEMERIHDILPKPGEKLPELRLRKLGNHKALGLYVPTKNTISIDFRDTDDEVGGVGIQSFVHEYGHTLDYGVDNGRLLSMRDDFKPIVARYRENLSLNGKGSYVAEKAGYYTAPTEVFARAFELYVSEAGLSSIFLKSKETYSTSIEYALFDQKMREKTTTFFDSVFPEIKTAVLESSKEQSELDQKVMKDQETMQERVDKEVDYVKSIKFFHENTELTVGEALESCELSLVGKAAAIQMQEEAVELYKNAIPQTDTMEQITAILKDSLEEIKEQPEGTLFLFDGSELADYSLDRDEMLSMIGEREVFHGVYGNSLPEVLFPTAVMSEQSQSSVDVKQIGDERSVSAAEEQLRKWLSLPEEAQNEILIITFRNPVNAKLALMKYGLEDVDNIFSSLNNPLGVEWEHRYKKLSEEIQAFDDKRREWLDVYGEERSMYIPKTLWPIAETLGMMENYSKLTDKVEQSLPIPNKAEATDLNLTSTNSTEAPTSEKENFEDNSRLGQARRKLLHLRNEYNEKFDQLFAHQELTNGQPMNDKRNGQSWFNRRDQIENSIRNLSDQIKQQEDRVAKLEEQKENKEMGLNKQGGLIMSVENIPRIQEEIEKSKNGESMFSKDTIRKYKKELEVLLEIKEQSEQTHHNVSPHAQALIASKAVTPWAKNPAIYFVKGLNKVALELEKTGDFVPSDKYKPHTAEEEKVVNALLKSNTISEFEARKASGEEMSNYQEQIKGVGKVPKESRKNEKSVELGTRIDALQEERMAYRDKQNWEEVSKIDWELRKLNLAVDVLDENTLDPVSREIAEFEIDIAGLESIDVSDISTEQTNSILERINQSKGYIEELKEIKENYFNFYQEVLGEEIKSSTNDSYSFKKEKQMPGVTDSLFEAGDINEQDQLSRIKSSNEENYPSNQSFINEINVSFVETRQEVDAFLEQMTNDGEQFASVTDIENILAKHLNQVEAIIKQSIHAVDTMSEPTENQIQAETTKVKRTISEILSDFKENLKKYVTTKKNNATYRLTNTMDDIRLGMKNSFNRKLLSINDLLKKLTNTIDQKVLIEEKQNQTPSVEETNDVQANVSQVPIQKEQEEIAKDPIVPEINSKVVEDENQSHIGTNESFDDKYKLRTEESAIQSEARPIDEGNASIIAEEAKQSVDENQMEKKMNNIELQQLKRIEELSDQLGLKASEKDKDTIKDLTQTQKSELIRSMEAAVEEKNKSVSVEVTDSELEVG